ncbi:LexA family protein [Delftia tsuruhatensis]|uniref:LexA family protein n=1 Tax=Delftia tsuruhatensis TaxID=180282 RepID=UPI0023D9A357|nr:translesion error-prone DNA polymerase V autoproteolytic subunit [Delftia tsuruhatensis]WEM01043.1 translesion error-prone DNA polymerase V autoproteolytic subunit [Delftia tsuruhatensis]
MPHLITSSNPVAATMPAMPLPAPDSPVRAGFPSPAEDFSCARIDLAKIMVKHPQCTFLLRVRGDSMIGAGIFDGDLLVVDKYLRPRHGDIVVAEVDGDFTCKRFWARYDQVMLRAENPTYPDIRAKEGQQLEIWGVVTCAVKSFRTL